MYCIFAAALSLLVGADGFAEALVPTTAYRWQVSEIRFVAASDYDDPFDFERTRLSAEFRGPGGRLLTVAGFWDGGRNWCVRFAPTALGRWEYVTSFSESSDRGLNGQRGSLDVKSVRSENSLREHGGFLAVSEDGRYLTFTDRTPFFWLGDTWWRAPSSFVPFDDFARMVDQRARQGFTVFQALGYAPFATTNGVGVFAAVSDATEDAVAYWREVDRYLAYAESKGLVGVIGLGGTTAFDAVGLKDLKRLWHYYLARYGAYPITFLITQEYNAQTGDPSARFAKTRALGRLIRESDPYRRAISAHPAVSTIDDLRAWDEDWYGFAMLQGGHFSRVNCDLYRRLRARVPPRPIVQSEHNYEGFERGGFKVTAEEVRRTAYSTIQCGAYGYTYGAQGLYGAVKDVNSAGPASKWGPAISWDAGLSLAGGGQMQHLRSFYESVEWWKTDPWDPRHVVGDALVRSDGYSTIAVYLGSSSVDRGPTVLLGTPKGASFDYDWFDPRTGHYLGASGVVTAGDRELVMPAAPSGDDWLLRLRARR